MFFPHPFKRNLAFVITFFVMAPLKSNPEKKHSDLHWADSQDPLYIEMYTLAELEAAQAVETYLTY